MGGYTPDQFRDLISRILIVQDLCSEAAINLLMGTAAQESHLGYYLRQVNGPALGAYQMEPTTVVDIWQNYLRFRPEKAVAVMRASGVYSSLPEALEYNLAYSTCMARLHYLRVKDPLPDKDNIYGLACYWKKFYNTDKGRGTVAEFEENYKRCVL